MKRNVALITAFTILSFFSWMVADGYAQSSPKRGGMVTVGLNTDVTAVDPHVTTAFVTSTVLNHVFERLIGHGENMELVPVLAERWDISPDYKTITFYLRKGKLFHNGREMVADDVKYSIERIMDPKTGNPRRTSLKNIDQIEVVDKYTVRIHMKKRDATILYALAYISPIMAVVPREEVEKQGGVMKHPVGTGPFKFVEWKPDRYVLLERFDQYKPQPGPINGFAGERIAYLDKIKFVPVVEESVATMALLNKEVDLLQYLPFKNVEKFRKDYVKRGIVVDEKPGQSWYEIYFGCKNPITSNVKFRQACAYAIDREVVSQAATRGYAAVNSSFVAVQNQYYTPLHKKWYKKDLAKAKKLLRESGYKGEEIEILTTKKYAMMYSIAVAVQSELAAAGIKAKLNVLEWANLIKTLYDGNYQIISFGHSARPDPVLAYIYLKYNGFDDNYPRMKEIRAEASKTLDFETRKKLFEEAHNLVYEGVPAIVFFNYNYFHAYWNYIKGYKMWGTNFIRLWGVWLEK
ncbi:MAG: hypothetical protein JRI22_16185 [Deltaproteobacteria bacterium]|nr:hypothetical protein [Deltaproteobacteria bacterium]